jgi:hypothetical protein
VAEKNVRLPDELLALVKQRADAEGLSVDEVAAQAVKAGLEEGRWRSLLAKGRRYGQQSGYTEDDAEALVQSFRNENRGR